MEKAQNIIDFLNRKVTEYNQPRFIADDPVSVPHRFSKKADIEIAAFFAAVFAWGNRTTIINKSNELMRRMDDAPHAFVLNHSEKEARSLLDFRHRTFNTTDLLYFIEFLNWHYSRHESLEDAFLKGMLPGDQDTENALNGFYQHFFSLEHVPDRTRKHIAAPFKKSTCKRLNMFLRWMVRKDNCGVDFGIWEKIGASRLICPVDVHVARVTRRFGLLKREAVDWQAAVELTTWLRKLDPADPVKYDFALFALGVVEKY
ncbi:TIGR02757 family protein [Flavihumibacter solisilvae]|uniref:TIGR02757 family protein n=1 Tax=Flavihumibacter solisilvae TaxID=1349421 RepID=A0A0C1LLX3_9BACT|nr:TIGR02757 family protein [Flavihumibacter solisilvae]KIC96338.1 hypothetical protein OI18_00855 [Flavihumibacter solisilvae]